MNQAIEFSRGGRDVEVRDRADGLRRITGRRGAGWYGEAIVCLYRGEVMDYSDE